MIGLLYNSNTIAFTYDLNCTRPKHQQDSANSGKLSLVIRQSIAFVELIHYWNKIVMPNTPPPPVEEFMQVDGYLIGFEYTLSLDNGQVLDSNVGKDPMVFHTGEGEMLPALEEEMLAMKEDESKKITLPPEKAYGPIQQEAFREFPLDAIPEEARQVGRKVMSRSPQGDEQMVDVARIEGDKVILDFNHELAGETLCFDIKIINKQQLG